MSTRAEQWESARRADRAASQGPSEGDGQERGMTGSLSLRTARARVGAPRAGAEQPRDAPTVPSSRSSAPGTLRAVRTLLRKELLVELRTLESAPGMVLFAVTTFVVFHFALNRGSVEGDLAAGILSVTLLLASLLGINRLFVADAEQGGFDALRLAPVEGSAVFLAKAISLVGYLALLELIAVPAFALLLLGTSLAQALPGLLLALCLADLGVGAVGALVAALAVRTRARDLLGPLLALPLLIPIVIGLSSSISPLFAPHAPAFARWLSGHDARWLI
ncbi:MAG: heme exporter protein CcmB, partial [Acidobacteriota bacterium]|nr:heme exporter protein CcmB [Acidobacteriota bacterium]